MAIPPVQVPVELLTAGKDVLEAYVQSRISQITSAFARCLQQHAPGLPIDIVGKSITEAYAAVPPPSYAVLPLEQRDLQLVFRHDCMALGCLDPQCVLCQHNPSRRCSVNFDRKYLVNDVLKAKCGSSIRIELVDRTTGVLIEEDIPDLRLEMFILDGNLYDSKFSEGGRVIEEGTEPEEELEACALILNKKKNTPLLVCGMGGANDAQGKVIIPMTDGGRAVLPELHISDSSEAILSGRKPPFRLLVRALLPAGRCRVHIHHAVSEGFVVATRRTRNTGKVDIPSIDDPVSKLEHMGRETVRKLQDIRAAAQQVGMDIDIPENCIEKVGDFKQLALRVDQDGPLRHRLQHVLKLSREKWDEAREHATRAVVSDSRLRAWYPDCRAMDVGLLFACRLGCVELERPVALIQSRREGRGEPKVQATMIADLVPMQRELVHRMQPDAARMWWLGGHPGWAIFPIDSEQFMQTGSLSAMSLLDSPMMLGAGMACKSQAQSGLPCPSGAEAATQRQGSPHRSVGEGPCHGQGSPAMSRLSSASAAGAGDCQAGRPSMGWPPGRPVMVPAGPMMVAAQLMPNMAPQLPGLPQGLLPPSQLPAGFTLHPHPGNPLPNPFRNTSISSKSPSRPRLRPSSPSPTAHHHQSPVKAGSTGLRRTDSPMGGATEGRVGPGSSGGGHHAIKRHLEPMLIPSPKGSQERHRREFFPPSSAAPNTVQPDPAPDMDTSEPEAAGEVGTADSDGSSPNPFLSVQHRLSGHSVPGPYAGKCSSHDGMAALPLDHDIFDQTAVCVLKISHSSMQQQQQQLLQQHQQQQQQLQCHQQQQQQHMGPAMHAAQHGNSTDLQNQYAKAVPMSPRFVRERPIRERGSEDGSLGLSFSLASGDLDGLLRDGSFNMGTSLPLPYNFLHGVMSTCPGEEGHMMADPRNAQPHCLEAAGGMGRQGMGSRPALQVPAQYNLSDALHTMQSIEDALPN